MTQLRYHYQSIFAPYIEGLIRQKNADGFTYDIGTYVLKYFDRFCVDNGYDKAIITHDIVAKWSLQRESEGLNYRIDRILYVRQLSLYMRSMGIDGYISHFHPSRETAIPRVLEKEELIALFNIIDTYLPKNPERYRYSLEYQVLFRMFYCCGMRLSESCNLRKEDVDLENGIITILQSKGDKDRLVYMTEDLTLLCRKYSIKIANLCPDTVWFFPGRFPHQHFRKTGIDRSFKRFWEMTPYAKRCSKEPTVHSLRHTFVVNRLNQWMSDGVSLEVMMPYLSRYLGHVSLENTMYYYHQVKDAFHIIRQKDMISENIIPEVVPNES